MTKLILGIGYNSGGSHKVKENGKAKKAANVWKHMIYRCYCPKTQEKNPTYIGCDVDKRWHDYQDFADWYYKHQYSNLGYQLDKDLLCIGNKTYSPENCCFVPQELNALLTDSRSARGEYPQGVSFKKRNSRYGAQLQINKKVKHLGYFDCPNEAHQAYKKAKEAYVKEKALEWKDRIADDVFQALMNWQLTE